MRYLLLLVKQVGRSYSSTCCFTEMSDPFVSGATWVGSCFSGGFVWKHVVTLKTLLLLRDVTGKALLSSAVVWFFVEMDSVLCCWFCDVTESLIGFSQPVLRRESSGLASGSRWRAMEGRSKRERATQTRLVLNCPILDPPTGGWSNQSVRMGWSPAHVHGAYPRYTFM